MHHVVREEPARRSAHPTREVGDADDRDAVAFDDLPRHAKLAVASLLGREIDDDRPALHLCHRLFFHEDGSLLPGDERSRDDDVDLGGLLSEERHLGLDERRAHLLRVAAAPLPILLDLDGEKRRAEALDLLLRRLPRVERAHLGAERLCGSDGGEARDARADDEHARRRHGPRSGDLRTEEPLVVMSGLEHRAVAGEIRHRREHVHLLRARHARDALERDRRYTPGREERRQRVVALRLEQRDEHRPILDLRDLRMRRRTHLDHDIALAPHRLGVGHRRPDGLVRLVGVARARPGGALDDDIEAHRAQLLHRLRRGSDTTLARVDLLRHSQSHRPRPSFRPPSLTRKRYITTA